MIQKLTIAFYFSAWSIGLPVLAFSLLINLCRLTLEGSTQGSAPLVVYLLKSIVLLSILMVLKCQGTGLQRPVSSERNLSQLLDLLVCLVVSISAVSVSAYILCSDAVYLDACPLFELGRWIKILSIMSA